MLPTGCPVPGLAKGHDASLARGERKDGRLFERDTMKEGRRVEHLPSRVSRRGAGLRFHRAATNSPAALAIASVHAVAI
jgi:hypothetical protein